MAHDVLWLSIRSDHPDEIAVHMEDGRNPDGSEAGNTGSSPWPCSCRASPSLVSSLGLARLRSSTHLLLPSGFREFAFLQVLTLIRRKGCIDLSQMKLHTSAIILAS